jgi:hypothetical protein
MARFLARFLGSLLLVVVTRAQAQEVSSAPTEFVVLRTDRVTVPAGKTTHLSCSVVGSGDAAQISCESQTSGDEPDESTAAGAGPVQLPDSLPASTFITSHWWLARTMSDM